MNRTEKSDRRVVPAKRPNNDESHDGVKAMADPSLGTKAETPETDKGRPTVAASVVSSSAEDVEGRRLAKGNPLQRPTHRTQGRGRVSPSLERIREAARKDRKKRFTALLHHVYDLSTLCRAYFGLKRSAAAGVDGVMWKQYGEDLEGNLADLSSRLRRGAYRAQPVRRQVIPKADGSPRNLGIATLEDKLVQSAVVEVLNAIYEVDFLGFSYGSRPGRSQHDALDALNVALMEGKVNWVLDADIRGFYDAIVHEWLEKFLEHRIGDRRVVRLIQKWLKAGVMVDGEWQSSGEGSPQGASISPLLGNLYLHYAFDLWAHQWRRKHSRGDVRIVRYCDDLVFGFEHRFEAEQFLEALGERLRGFGLELHPEKTRLIEFGFRNAYRQRKQGGRRLSTFNFLGFTHYGGWTRGGGYRVMRTTESKRANAKLKELTVELMRRRHLSIPDQGKWLASVVVGHCRYYGVPFNSRALQRFRFRVVRRWHRALSRRSQRGYVRWNRMRRLAKRWIPRARIFHDYPDQRFHRRTRGRSPVR